MPQELWPEAVANLDPPIVALMRVLHHPTVSLCDSTTYEGSPQLNGVVRRIPHPMTPLSPVVVPSQAKLALLWLSRRTNRELDLDPDSLAATLAGAEILCAAVGIRAAKAAPLQDKQEVEKENIELFLKYAQNLRIPPSLLFHPHDLLLCQDLPRVIRTLAALSHRDCPPVMDNSLLQDARTQWSQSDEPNESWTHDIHARHIASKANNAGLSSLGIAVIGDQGSGKTELSSALMGRRTAPSTHRLALQIGDTAIPAHARLRRMRSRALKAKNWPIVPWDEGGVLASTRVSKLRVRIENVSLSVLEIPSTTAVFEEIDVHGANVFTKTADFTQIRSDLQGESVHILLLVTRCDHTDMSPFIAACRNAHRLFGARIWQRAVLALTHADALPPARQTDRYYWRHVAEQRAVVVLRKFAPHILVPIVPVDSICGSGLEQLASRLAEVVGGESSQLVVHAMRPKRWWEDYVLGTIGLLLLKILENSQKKRAAKKS